MGRLIEADRLKDILEYGILCNVPADAVNTEEEKWNDWVQEVVAKAPTVEAIPKADYENRLKADMVAMLEELEKKIEGQCKIPNNCASAYDWNNGVYACYKVIEQKINSLKEIKDDKYKSHEIIK